MSAGVSPGPADEVELLRETNLALRETLDGVLRLQEVAGSILVKTGTLEIARALADAARELVGAKAVQVYLSSTGAKGYVLVCSRPEEAPAPEALDLAAETMLWILRERKAAFLSDSCGDRMVLPLYSARLCEGMLLVRFPAGHEGLTEEIQGKLSGLATAAAASLQNARLNDALARAGAFLANILESVSHGICVTDNAGRVTHANNNFLLMFDLGAPGEAVWRLLGEVLEEPVRLVFQEVAADAEREGFALDRLFERKDPGGAEINLGVSATFLRDPQGERLGVIYLCRDMTASRELERLRRLTQLKSEFVNNVSHELRTPLTSIKAYTEALQEMLQEETCRRFLRVIAEESDRLLEMIENLLNVSRIESGKLRLRREKTQPADLIASVLSVSKIQFGNHTLATEIQPDLPAMSLDVGKMKEVLLNLLSNAIKYSPQGGEIRVRACLEEGNLRIDVRDSGIGISPENQKRLFEPFFRVETDETQPIRGTGLGLAITKKIVEAHGGTIRLKSAPGTGSTFTVLLPVSGRLSDEEVTYGDVSSSPFA